MSGLSALPADGWTARWDGWDGEATEELTLRWENEAWTASGVVTGENIQYVVRLSPLWEVRQFLLFRDLDQPDLWLGTDGVRWGEVNGSHRDELTGASDIAVGCTPFDHVAPVRRLSLEPGGSAAISVACVDVETLGVSLRERRYERLSERRWSVVDTSLDIVLCEFGVDDYGRPVDVDGAFRRR